MGVVVLSLEWLCYYVFMCILSLSDGHGFWLLLSRRKHLLKLYQVSNFLVSAIQKTTLFVGLSNGLVVDARQVRLSDG